MSVESYLWFHVNLVLLYFPTYTTNSGATLAWESARLVVMSNPEMLMCEIEVGFTEKIANSLFAYKSPTQITPVAL